MSNRTRKQPAHVWVVEVLSDDGWEAVRLSYSRGHGRDLVRCLSRNGYEYRLRKYVREEKP